MALVLVVDDEPTARAFARMVLLAGGHEVVEAKSGEEALDRMAERPPDCIVLDLVMPGLSGLERRSSSSRPRWTRPIGPAASGSARGHSCRSR
jgi:CheY-like chemotaxis protein